MSEKIDYDRKIRGYFKFVKHRIDFLIEDYLTHNTDHNRCVGSQFLKRLFVLRYALSRRPYGSMDAYKICTMYYILSNMACVTMYSVTGIIENTERRFDLLMFNRFVDTEFAFYVQKFDTQRMGDTVSRARRVLKEKLSRVEES